MMRNYRIIITAVFLLLFTFCTGSKESIKKNDVVVFPSPPAEPRIQFLTSISKSSDITGKQSEFMASIIGAEKERVINKPYGISINQGKIYICDSMLGGIIIIDLNKSTFENFIPKGMGQLKKPINCFIDADQQLFVTDAERKQIVVFDKNGNYLKSFGEREEATPIDVFVEGSNIWVADLKNHRVLVYDKITTDLLFTIPNESSDTTATLYSPTNICIKNNKLYVSDFGGFNIKVFSTDGEYLQTIGSYGRNLGQFVRQKGIAVDKDENLYVVDAGFENVQIFNKDGNLLLYFGGPYSGPGDMWLPAKVIIDYDNMEYFQRYVDEKFNLKYLIFVTNQYGPDKLNVYGFVESKSG